MTLLLSPIQFIQCVHVVQSVHLVQVALLEHLNELNTVKQAVFPC